MNCLLAIIIKVLRNASALGFCVMLLNASCRKENRTKPCRDVRYSFTVKSTVIPELEVYRPGDSIFLTSAFPKINRDFISNTQIDYSHAKAIGGNISFYEFDSVQVKALPALTRFKIIPLKGTVVVNPTQATRVTDIIYAETEEKYEFSCAIVVGEKGIYAIGITDLLCQGIPGRDCTNAGFSNTLTNTDNHLNLFLPALMPPVAQYGSDRIYCFRVQ